MTKSTAIIFDLDGTLVDSVRDLMEAMNDVLRELSRPTHALDAYRRFVGDGARMLVARARGEPAEDDAVDEALARFRRRYLAALTVHTAPYPGVEATLAAVRERGVPSAVLTNKPHDAAVQVVTHYFPGHPFVAVFGQHQGVPRKPHPGAALGLARMFARRPSEVAFLGDSDVDMATAKAAGMRALGAAWGLRGRAELESAGAEHVLEAPEEVLAHLTGQAERG
ncbi:MAG: HAD family hydrolase [Sandaracinaceae bacterium]